MKTFKTAHKQFIKCTTVDLLNYVKGLVRQGFGPELGEYASLTALDFNQETCYLIHLENRMVGFITVRYGRNDDARILSKLYVLPTARSHGCATWVLTGLKITNVNTPVRNIRLISLCRQLGFQYNDHQSHPTSLAELSRRVPEKKFYGRPNPFRTPRMG